MRRLNQDSHGLDGRRRKDRQRMAGGVQRPQWPPPGRPPSVVRSRISAGDAPNRPSTHGKPSGPGGAQGARNGVCRGVGRNPWRAPLGAIFVVESRRRDGRVSGYPRGGTCQPARYAHAVAQDACWNGIQCCYLLGRIAHRLGAEEWSDGTEVVGSRRLYGSPEKGSSPLPIRAQASSCGAPLGIGIQAAVTAQRAAAGGASQRGIRCPV